MLSLLSAWSKTANETQENLGLRLSDDSET